MKSRVLLSFIAMGIYVGSAHAELTQTHSVEGEISVKNDLTLTVGIMADQTEFFRMPSGTNVFSVWLDSGSQHQPNQTALGLGAWQGKVNVQDQTITAYAGFDKNQNKPLILKVTKPDTFDYRQDLSAEDVKLVYINKQQMNIGDRSPSFQLDVVNSGDGIHNPGTYKVKAWAYTYNE